MILKIVMLCLSISSFVLMCSSVSDFQQFGCTIYMMFAKLVYPFDMCLWFVVFPIRNTMPNRGPESKAVFQIRSVRTIQVGRRFGGRQPKVQSIAGAAASQHAGMPEGLQPPIGLLGVRRAAAPQRYASSPERHIYLNDDALYSPNHGARCSN